MKYREGGKALCEALHREMQGHAIAHLTDGHSSGLASFHISRIKWPLIMFIIRLIRIHLCVVLT